MMSEEVRPDRLFGELRSLLAMPATLERDAQLSILLCFHSRVHFEQSGAWDYLCEQSARGRLGTTWSDASWLDVRAGRMWGKATEACIDLSGTWPIHDEVLSDIIAQTHVVPPYALDLSELGEDQFKVLTQFLAHANLERLTWLNLCATAAPEDLVNQIAHTPLPGLRSLELGGVSLRGLDHAPWLSQLVHLGVARCDDVSAAWWCDVVSVERMPALRSIDVEETALDDGIWQSLAEEQGYEQFYALKIARTDYNSNKLDVMQWLPCVGTLDTLSLDFCPDERVQEALLEWVEAARGVRALGFNVVGLTNEGKARVIDLLTDVECYDRLCALEMDGVQLSDEYFALLARESRSPALLRHFAIKRPELPQSQHEQRWFWSEPLSDVVDYWDRLAYLESFEVDLSGLEGRESALYYAFYGIVDYIYGMTKLKRVACVGFNASLTAALYRVWSKGKAFEHLERLSVLRCEVHLAGLNRSLGEGLPGPARWVVDGLERTEREIVLDHVRDKSSPVSAMQRWLRLLAIDTV